jgi:hypothetical protein
LKNADDSYIKRNLWGAMLMPKLDWDKKKEIELDKLAVEMQTYENTIGEIYSLAGNENREYNDRELGMLEILTVRLDFARKQYDDLESLKYEDALGDFEYDAARDLESESHDNQ